MHYTSNPKLHVASSRIFSFLSRWRKESFVRVLPMIHKSEVKLLEIQNIETLAENLLFYKTMLTFCLILLQDFKLILH